MSTYVASSEKYQRYSIKNMTIIITIVNFVVWVLFIGVKIIKGMIMKDFTDFSTMLFVYSISNLLMFSYMAIVYKRRIISNILLVVYIVSVVSSALVFYMILLFKDVLNLERYITDNNAILDVRAFLEGRLILTFLPGTAVMTIISFFTIMIVSPLVFYILSMSLRKVPINQKIIERQQYNKL